MDAKVMKKMIVLKNLQSNMVEEAYVVFKNNVKAHKYEKVNRQNKEVVTEENKTSDYMIREAEMIINDYICKMESKEFSFNNKSLKQKNNILKVATVSFALLSVLNFAMFIFK
ncbi:MAG: hypothetical protein J6M60_07015 [Clostridia bacterium]|nr:hypothetical protein [Clostridia bacterium]